MKRNWNMTREHHGCFSCASTDLTGIYCLFAFLPFSESAQDLIKLGLSAWESCADLSCRIRAEETVLGALPSITVQGALNLN